MTAPELPFTGERVVPGAVDRHLWEEHVARYQFAAGLFAALPDGSLVLDLACGTGYGTRLLCEAGLAAQGVDVGAEAIAFAEATFGAPLPNGLTPTYQVADATATGLSDHAFSAITAFEILEHIPHPDQLLIEIRRLLAPGGLALVSTPNKLLYQASGENHYHFTEYTQDEFIAMLEEAFPGWSTTLYGQRPRGVSGSSTAQQLRKTYIGLKRAVGIGPILPKQIPLFDPTARLLDLPLSYEFSTTGAATSEYFVALLRAPAG